MNKTLFYVGLSLAAFAAHAGHEPKPSTPNPSSNSSSTSATSSAALGVGVGIGKGGDANSHSVAVGKGGNATGGRSIAGASASNAGNQLATSYSTDFDSLALALPGQTGAPAVVGECLEHTRGGSGLSIGVSGRTRINEGCATRMQCLALADRYAAWGQVQLAVTQLASCGGVQNPTLFSPPAHDDPSPATREYIDRVFRSNVRK